MRTRLQLPTAPAVVFGRVTRSPVGIDPSTVALIAAPPVPRFAMGTIRATPKRMARLTSGKRKPRATTEVVLGNSVGNAKVPARWQTHYRRLIKMRDEITRERRRRVDQGRELKHRAHGDNIADAGTDAYDQDFALGIASSEQQ